jgi:hypothetical protein
LAKFDLVLLASLLLSDVGKKGIVLVLRGNGDKAMLIYYLLETVVNKDVEGI